MKDEQVTLSFDSCRTSVTSESSFASILSSLSLHADSIVVWFDTNEPRSVEPSQVSSGVLSVDSINPVAHTGGNTALQSSLATRNIGRPTKILMGGLQMEAVRDEQSQASAHQGDSASCRLESNSNLSVIEKNHDDSAAKSGSYARVYIILGVLLALIVGAAIWYIKKKLF